VATLTLTPNLRRFPAGTDLAAWEFATLPTYEQELDARPAGATAATATSDASTGEVVFAGLAADTAYVVRDRGR
jgi:hypothetical protein